MNDEFAVRTEGLTRYYGELLAVDGLTFEIRTGEIFGLLGPNGAGKTTTIRMLVGLIKPSGGRAWVGGYDVVRERLAVKSCVGVVPEQSNLYDELSLRENLTFVGHLYGVPGEELRARTESLLRQFGLWERREQPFVTLSRGLKRRLTIAAALIHAPSLLFLDEPTTGLDVISARALRRQIRELKEQGVTIFLTTHLIAEAEALCDRVAILVGGRLKAMGSPASLRQMTQGQQALEIELSPLDGKAVEALRGCPGIEDVYIMGDRVRIQVGELSAVLPLVVRRLEEMGVGIKSVNTLRPTLEDAFVRLTGLEAEAMLLEKGG